MNRGDFSFKLFLIDNTSHMDRVVNGTPLLSFFRFNKPPPGNVLIAYSDQYGNPKCEEYSQQLIQNMVTTPLGDYKSICRFGLTEMAKKKFSMVEDFGKKSEFKLTNDGRGLQPLAQDSDVIIFCSDFYSFSPNFFKIARVGVFSSEYLIRPIDRVICLGVDESPDTYSKIKADCPPWVIIYLLIKSNPYAIDNVISQLYNIDRYFCMKLVFPDTLESYCQIPLQYSKDAWPLPYDTCITSLKNRDSPIPTYYVFPTIGKRNLNYAQPNQYNLEIISSDKNSLISPNPTEDGFTVHTSADSPPFAFLDRSETTNWRFIALPWDFPFLEKPNKTPDIVSYLKNIPLAYFNLTQQYLFSKGFDVKRVESSHDYSSYLQERRETFTSLGKQEFHSNILSFPSSMSLEAIRIAMKNSDNSLYKTVNSYEIIENYDTADDQNWNSFNTLVFQKNIYNQMWKSESLVSLDRIRELMPNPKVKQEETLEEFDETIEEAPQQQQQQQVKNQQIPSINKNDQSFFKLDQLVMILRERDVNTLRSILESLKNENSKEYMFAKSFLLRAIDRFGLAGILDPLFVDSLK